MTLPLAELKKSLPLGRLDAGAGRARCAVDCWPQALSWTSEEKRAHTPAAVALPADEGEVSGVLEWCSRHEVRVVARGAGSSVVGAAIPGVDRSIVLDTSLLTRRFVLEAGESVPRVRVGSGWLGGELESRLNEAGWSLMHFPASMDISAVGGWIALDGYGQLSTRYGGIGEQTLSVRTALPDGSLREEEGCGPHLGAEGTVGVIAEAALRVRPLPERRGFHAFAFPDSDAALGFARAALARKPAPSVLRLYSPVDALLTGLSRGFRGGGGKIAPPWFRGVEMFFMRRHRWVNALTPLAGKKWIAVAVYEEENGERGGPPAGSSNARDLGPGPAERWWPRRYHWSRERLERAFAGGCFADTIDLWGPWEKLAVLEREVRRALSRHAFAFSHYSHFDAAGACLYVTFGGSNVLGRHAQAWSDAIECCLAAGGNVNHHHGFGLAKLPWLKKGRSKSWLDNLRRERTARDPHGLLNPDKLASPA